MKTSRHILKYTFLSILISIFFSACGGGGGGGSTSTTTTTDSSSSSSSSSVASATTLSIVASDGYIYNSTMSCDKGIATLNSDNLTFTINTLTPGNCEISGGSHLVNGKYITNQSKLGVYIDNGASGEKRYATPLTTLVSKAIQKGTSQTLAKKKVASLMGINPNNSSDIDTLLYGDPTKLDQLNFNGSGNDFEAKKARNGIVALYTMMEHFSSAGASESELNNALTSILNKISDSINTPSEELNTTTLIDDIKDDLNTSTLTVQFTKIQQLLQAQETKLLSNTAAYSDFENLVDDVLEVSNSLESATSSSDANTSIGSSFDTMLDKVIAENNTSTSSSDTSSLTYPIVDTAQTKCYDSTTGSEIPCSAHGYDADYNGSTPSYTLNSAGTILTDNVTGLMWTKSSDLDGNGNVTDAGDKLSFNNAVEYCSNLTLGGYDDWRLPDIKTLYSLIMFTGEDPSSYSRTDTSSLVAFLDKHFDWAFGDQDAGERIIDGQYATTTKYVSTTMNGDETMFGVNFVDGRIKGYPINMGNSEKLFYVLCTRGNKQYGENNFTDNGDSTITDNATALMWQQNDTQSSNYEDAISYCEDSTLAGYSDWRVPNVKELQSIVDYSKSPDTSNSAAINPLFNATSFTNENGVTDWGYYWSSTTHATANSGKSGAYVSFGRALGYMNNTIMDVHGAGAQRSNAKMSENDMGASTATDYNGNTFYYKGPQGDIIRIDNMVRCVRDTSVQSVSDGYILFSTMGDKNTYLLNTDKSIVKTYTSTYNASSSSYLTSNYTLLRAGLTNNAKTGTFSSGGAVGGIIEELDSNSNVIWSYTSDSDQATLHHDFKQIDDNTILALAWELKSYNGNDYWNEKVLKIDKSSKSVIWSWSAMDNGSIYPTSSSKDYIHFNSIDYKNGKILLSSRALNKIIEVNESSKAITKEYTANNTLNGQHDASYLDNGDILVFNNNDSNGNSSVLELDGNDNYNATKN